ncbi:MAG: enolase C-terminal domain-like protein [Acidimicrobiia bacterium]
MNSLRPLAHIYVLDIPLLQPFTTASGTVSRREVAVVSLSVDGETGWGEAAPYPGQDETFASVVKATRDGATTPTLSAALDEALADLVARLESRRLTDDVPGIRTELPSSIAVGMGPDVLEIVDTLAADGISRIKAKIAPGHTDHIRAIRDAHPDLTMGVDANGSFDSSTWGELMSLSDENVAYLEQPMTDLAGAEIVALSEAGFMIFADESVRSVEQASDVLDLPGVSGVVVKPGRLGWRGSLAVIAASRGAGMSWRASGLLETGIGRAFSEALAAAEDAFVSDIAPAQRYIAYDTVVSRSKGAGVVVPSGHGIGIDVDEERVAGLAIESFPINPLVVPILD